MKTDMFPSRGSPMLLTIPEYSPLLLALAVGQCWRTGSAGFMGCTSTLNSTH